jgi:hypothetical protein
VAGAGIGDRVAMPTGSHRGIRELRHLEKVAEAGESEETPWIVLGGVWVLCAVAVVALLALTALAAYLAS